MNLVIKAIWVFFIPFLLLLLFCKFEIISKEKMFFFNKSEAWKVGPDPCRRIHDPALRPVLHGSSVFLGRLEAG